MIRGFLPLRASIRLQTRRLISQPMLASSFSLRQHNRFMSKEPEKEQEPPQAKQQEHKEEQKSERQKTPVSWRMVLATGVLCTGIVMIFNRQKAKQNVTVKKGRTVGRPKLGGDWDNLVDTNGVTRSSEDFRGKYHLIYFGFINCPDICPTELKKMEMSFALLHAKMDDPENTVVPVFISVDPTRDTPEALAKYSESWMPSIQWLTGDIKHIAEVAKKFRVYFSVPEVEEGDDDDYLVDHSIFFYLMDRQGKLMEIWGKNHTAEEMSQGIYAAVCQDMSTDA